MRTLTNVSFIIAASLVVAGFGVESIIAQAGSTAVSVENGSASFSVATTIPAIEVSGKSKALKVNAQVHKEGDGLTLERVEAVLPVKTINTGMALRDDHMRKYIFTTSKGEVPDLRFESEKVTCAGLAPSHEVICPISGNLAIRGVSHGFSVPLKVKQEGTGSTYRVTGDAVVKLSDYGIERPSQLGVSTSNEVKIHLEFSAKESAQVASVKEGH